MLHVLEEVDGRFEAAAVISTGSAQPASLKRLVMALLPDPFSHLLPRRICPRRRDPSIAHTLLSYRHLSVYGRRRASLGADFDHGTWQWNR